MSFLIPIFAAGIGTALAEVGATTAVMEAAVAGGAELGLGANVSRSIAGSAIGAGVGAVAETAGSFIGSEIDKSYGAGTSDIVSKRVEQIKKDSADIAGAVVSGNYQDLLRKKIGSKYVVDAQGFVTRVPDETPSESVGSDPIYSKTFGLPGKDPTVTGSMTQYDLYNSSVSNTNLSGSLITAPRPVENPVVKTKEIAKELGNLISEHTQEVISEPTKMVTSFPTTSYLSGPVIEYYMNKDINDYIPNNDSFKQIYSVYDGLRIVRESVHEDSNSFGAFEEDGSVAIYRKHGPEYKSLRPIYPGHTWTGPQSPNNKLPVDLWDTFSFYHDVGYQKNGWFSRIDDYKYISRLLHGLEYNRFPPEQVPFIRATIIYFSTMGSALSFFNSDTSAAADKQYTYSPTGPTESKSNVHFLNYVDSNINVDESLKKVFSDTLKETIIENSRNVIVNSANAIVSKELQELSSIQIALV